MSRFGQWFASPARRWGTVAAVAVLLVAVAQVRGKQPVVKVAQATVGALTLNIAASGRVEGEASDLSFGESGTIVSLSVREGDAVVEQQVLARIEPGPGLAMGGMGDVGGAGSSTVIQAPFNGHVVTIYRREGSAAQPGLPVLRVVRDGESWVTAFVDSEDASALKVGAKLTVRAGGYLARPWDAVVETIGREAVPREDVPGAARQVRLRLRLMSPGFDLPVGASVDVDGDVPLVDKALLVPAAAVTKALGRTRVWQVVDERIHQVEVRTGANNFRQIVIHEGLEAGATVVVEGKADLEEGQRVRAERWQEAD